MILQEINNESLLYKGIAVSFLHDEELISKYHIIEESDYQTCVNDTFEKIIETTRELPLEWFLVRNDNREIIGYCVLSKAYNYLYSFGINKNYRKGNVLSAWFIGISEILQNHFICGLWAKNKRAVDFLVKNGMKIFEEDNNIVKLKYN